MESLKTLRLGVLSEAGVRSFSLSPKRYTRVRRGSPDPVETVDRRSPLQFKQDRWQDDVGQNDEESQLAFSDQQDVSKWFDRFREGLGM